MIIFADDLFTTEASFGSAQGRLDTEKTFFFRNQPKTTNACAEGSLLDW